VPNWVIVALMAGFLSFPALPQNAKSESPKCRRVYVQSPVSYTYSQKLTLAEFLLPEDANAAKDAFRSFRKALLNGDRETVVRYVRLPLDVVLSGSPVRLKDAHDLLDRYDKVFTSFAISSVREQDPGHLLLGWNGVSVESGAIRYVWENNSYVVGDIIPSALKPPTGDVAKQLIWPVESACKQRL
jgi:hypothetical protein